MPKTKIKWKSFKPGDAIEVWWKDASTKAEWMDLEGSISVPLPVCRTRGTLVNVDDEAVRIALDDVPKADGSFSGTCHGVGVIEINSVAKAKKLR